jgi:hypothetical protein
MIGFAVLLVVVRIAAWGLAQLPLVGTVGFLSAGLVVLFAVGIPLRLLWGLVGRPLAIRRGIVEPTADDLVVEGWGAERAGQWAEALAAYDEALRREPWDEEVAARRAALLHRFPNLANVAEEAEWARLSALDPAEVLARLGAGASERKLRLVAVAYWRRVERLLADDLGRAAVEAAERYAEGGTIPEEVVTLLMVALAARGEGECDPATDLRHSVGMSLSFWREPHLAAAESLWLTAEHVGREGQVRLLRCVLGPFRCAAAAAPQWRTDTAVTLARQMDEAGDFSAMPILADALQDAGCEDGTILNHCRSGGVHARGCWVVDLVLGKE